MPAISHSYHWAVSTNPKRAQGVPNELWILIEERADWAMIIQWYSNITHFHHSTVTACLAPRLSRAPCLSAPFLPLLFSPFFIVIYCAFSHTVCHAKPSNTSSVFHSHSCVSHNFGEQMSIISETYRSPLVVFAGTNVWCLYNVICLIDSS